MIFAIKELTVQWKIKLITLSGVKPQKEEVAIFKIKNYLLESSL